jgi:hypothetical protein
MNIILGDELPEGIGEKYVVLPLDRLRIKGVDTVQSYCLVENLPIDEMFHVDHYVEMHQKLMENYERRNWLYCHQAIQSLKGKWHGELDSFYDHLQARINELEQQDLAENWSPVIDV